MSMGGWDLCPSLMPHYLLTDTVALTTGKQTFREAHGAQESGVPAGEALALRRVHPTQGEAGKSCPRLQSRSAAPDLTPEPSSSVSGGCYEQAPPLVAVRAR